MYKRYYETIFNVTETLQNGKERRIKKSVYGDIFVNGKNNSEPERIKKGTKALKEMHYYNIEFVKSYEYINIYDSNQYNAYNGVEEMLEQEGIQSYTVSENWTDLIDDIFMDEYELQDGRYIDLSDGSEITKERIINNDFCNKIGNIYVFVTEF